MTPTNKFLCIGNLVRSSLLVCAALGLYAVVGATGAGQPAGTAGYVSMDPVVFGSSSGQASLKAAPATWSSRSNVRWNARWSSEGRYLV